jgi:hypothetical protein
MSRTHRRQPEEKTWFKRNYRRPRTFNEKKQIEDLIHDEDVKLSNREKSKLNNLPTAWDDIPKSSIYEQDYNNEN